MTEHTTPDTSVEGLTDLLLESPELTGFLDEFTTLIADTLAGDGKEVWCAVTLLRDKHAATVASSSPRAAACDEIQLPFGDGPCLTAAREHRVVYVPDTRTDARWPGYGQAAAAAGILCALGIPFELAGEAWTSTPTSPTPTTRPPSPPSSSRWWWPPRPCAWRCAWPATTTPRPT
ncbi:GAF domain-containing protein [Kocuria rosea]|uniref:GAF domain-containing protein n=1 Tax=Kocuria rosea TaxID=1275 RepID=UPI00203C2EB1|nr:GAF domain-containing protein [Kocuria rosea]MCM3688837.1 GAF domain-containing protein [Kocuria rosea]